MTPNKEETERNEKRVLIPDESLCKSVLMRGVGLPG